MLTNASKILTTITKNLFFTLYKKDENLLSQFNVIYYRSEFKNFINLQLYRNNCLSYGLKIQGVSFSKNWGVPVCKNVRGLYLFVLYCIFICKFSQKQILWGVLFYITHTHTSPVCIYVHSIYKMSWKTFLFFFN